MGSFGSLRRVGAPLVVFLVGLWVVPACNDSAPVDATPDTIFGWFSPSSWTDSTFVGAPTRAYIDARDHYGADLANLALHLTSSSTTVAKLAQPSDIKTDGYGGATLDVTPLTRGTVTFTAIASGVQIPAGAAPTFTYTVFVGGAPASFGIEPHAPLVAVGATIDLLARVRDVDGQFVGSGVNVTWQSLDPGIADFRSSSAEPPPPGTPLTVPGKWPQTLQSKQAGVARIVARVAGTTLARPADTVLVSVVGDVARVVPEPASVALVVGGTRRLTAKAFDASGAQIVNATIDWLSRDVSVVSTQTPQPADGSVTVKALSTGAGNPASATVQVLARAQKADRSTIDAPVTVTVYQAVDVVRVQLARSTAAPGETTQAAATLADKGGNAIPLAATSITWSSDDPTIATVDRATGVVTAVAPGQARIRATTAEGISGLATLTVAPPRATPADLQLFKLVGTTFQPASSSETIRQNASLTLAARVVDATGTELPNETVTWSSADPTVATVDASTGVVTPKRVGMTVLTATSTSTPALRRSLTLVVTAATGVPVRMTISPTNPSVKVGAAQRFVVTLYDAAGQPTIVEPGAAVGFAVDDSQIARDPVIDPADPLAATVQGRSAGSTTVRAFYVRGTQQTNVFASTGLTVTP